MDVIATRLARAIDTQIDRIHNATTRDRIAHLYDELAHLYQDETSRTHSDRADATHLARAIAQAYRGTSFEEVGKQLHEHLKQTQALRPGARALESVRAQASRLYAPKVADRVIGTLTGISAIDPRA